MVMGSWWWHHTIRDVRPKVTVHAAIVRKVVVTHAADAVADSMTTRLCLLVCR